MKRWIIGIVLSIVLAVLLMFFLGMSFVSFTVRNFQQQPVKIAEVSASTGLIFESPDFLDHHEIGSFWGIFPSRNISLDFVINEGEFNKNFHCNANRQGSDSCAVEIYDHTLECECFQ